MSDFPSSWTKAKFEDLFDIAIGGTPSRNEPLYWDSEYKTSNFWVSIRDLKERVILNTAERISNLGIQKSNAKLVLKDTVIMSFKLSVGKVAIAGRDLYTNEAIAAFKPINEKAIDLSYFYQGLHSWDLLGDVDQAVKGVTLNKEKLRNIEAILPPLPEQQKIAQILTSVDEVIEKTQAQIDKLKDLKTGMMQELLTKGIGHVEFKDSPVGTIPVGWEVVEISKLCSDVVDCVNKTASVVDYKTQYKMIRTTNVRHGRVDTENVRNVTKETYESWTRRLRPENGDLIFTREAPVGECGVLEDSRGVFLGQRTMMYRPNEQLTSSKFLMYSLTSNYGKQQLEDFSGGSTVAHMRVPDCSKILIKTPPIEEQNKIVIAINSIDDSIQKKEIKLAAINSTKKALMQDLLTGKVRVTVNNN
jgi:type I restriction enzyme S subunit